MLSTAFANTIFTKANKKKVSLLKKGIATQDKNEAGILSKKSPLKEMHAIPSMSSAIFYKEAIDEKRLNQLIKNNNLLLKDRLSFSYFRTQQQAIDYIAKQGDTTDIMDQWCLFAREYTGQSQGKREFVAVRLKDFVLKYLALPDADRRFYEVIQPDKACRLYFDIEFDTSVNSDKANKHEVMMSVFIQLLSNFVYKEYNLYVDIGSIVDLDSSPSLAIPIAIDKDMDYTPGITPAEVVTKKFSRHIICHIYSIEEHKASTDDNQSLFRKEVLFHNNIHVGIFVKHFVKWMDHLRSLSKSSSASVSSSAPSSSSASLSASSSSLSASSSSSALTSALLHSVDILYVNSNSNSSVSSNSDTINDKKVIFIDLAVYTKNRCFRLWLSSKSSKQDSRLDWSTSSVSSTAIRASNFTRKQFLLDTFITYVTPSSSLASQPLSIASDNTNAVKYDTILLEIPFISCVSCAMSKIGQLLCFESDNYYGNHRSKSNSTFNLAYTKKVSATKEIRQNIDISQNINPGLIEFVNTVVASGCPPSYYFHEDNEYITTALSPSSSSSSFSSSPPLTKRRKLNHGSGYVKSWLLHSQTEPYGDATSINTAINDTNSDGSDVYSFNVQGTRYCHNIQRQHKSNGVYYVADIGKQVLYQKCYDNDCKDYRGPYIRLPYYAMDKDHMNNEFDNALLNHSPVHHEPNQQHYMFDDDDAEFEKALSSVVDRESNIPNAVSRINPNPNSNPHGKQAQSRFDDDNDDFDAALLMHNVKK